MFSELTITNLYDAQSLRIAKISIRYPPKVSVPNRNLKLVQISAL